MSTEKKNSRGAGHAPIFAGRTPVFAGHAPALTATPFPCERDARGPRIPPASTGHAPALPAIPFRCERDARVPRAQDGRVPREDGRVPRAPTIWIVLIIAIATLLIFPPAVRAAQSINVADINLGIIGEDGFNDGYAFIPSHTIFWESDIPWRITIRSYDPDLGTSDSGTYVKPLSDLYWKLSDTETWLPMTQEEEELDWSTETGDGVIYVDFAVLLAWKNDVPGRYGTELIFTIESL